MLVLLALPILGLETDMPSIKVVPKTDGSRIGYEQMQRAFGAGAPAALQIAAPQRQAAAVAAAARRDPGIARVLPPEPGAAGLALVQAIPNADPSSRAVGRTIDRLRAALPSGALVGGQAAENHDLAQALRQKTPLVIGVVLTLGFLLLLVAVRAPLIAALAVVTNLLATGAAFGIGRLIFQDGHGAGLLGFESQGFMDAWAPVFFFAMIFAISMDYTVFLLASTKEHWDRSHDPREAVVGGLADSGRVIFAAAAVMVAVFFTFALSGPLPPKEMGVILGVSVLLDAMLVRLVLLPALLRRPRPARVGSTALAGAGSSPTSASGTERGRPARSWDHACVPPLRAKERAKLPDERLCIHRLARPAAAADPRCGARRGTLSRGFDQVAFEDDGARDRARNRLLRAAKKHGIMPIGFISAQLHPQRKLPKGQITFLLTDIEGSTELLGRLGDQYAGLLADVRRVMRGAVRRAGGHDVSARGDDVFAVFERAPAALVAALAIQRAMRAGSWPGGSMCGCGSACTAGVPSSPIPATSASRSTPPRASALRRTAGRSCVFRRSQAGLRVAPGGGQPEAPWRLAIPRPARAGGSLPGPSGRPARRVPTSALGRPCRVTRRGTTQATLRVSHPSVVSLASP